ncbi:MAG: ACT domain-containing protein [Phycisphaerales bacterium]|nr:ACT domain-containing protein [Planctomycetota bacterium]
MATPRHQLRLRVICGRYSYARLEPDAPIPVWAEDATFSFQLRTLDELAVICPCENVPANVRQEGPWKIIKIDATLDFNQVGIIASLAAPLAEAGVSIAPIASFDTDYVLVREESLDPALAALRAAGHTVI